MCVKKKIDTNNWNKLFIFVMLKIKFSNVLVSAFVVVFLTVIDILTKHFVFAMEDDMTYVLPVLNIVKAKNFGITFGLFYDKGAWMKYFVIVFDVAVIALLLYNITKKNSYRKPSIFVLSILLIICGAIGNLFDRVFYGYVRDFIDFHIFNYHWYIFNVADIYICVGVAVLIICELFFREKSK